MRIGVLANSSSWYLTDLQRAAGPLDVKVEHLDFTSLLAGVVGTRRPREWIAASRSTLPNVVPGADPRAQVELAREADERADDRAGTFDAIIVRTMPPGSLEQVVFRMDVLQRLEARGVRVVNSARALECAVDKYLTTVRLHAAGLPVPATLVCEGEAAALAAFEELGRDVVVKPLFGAEGRGIIRVSDPDLAQRAFRTLERLDSVLYLQEYIDHGGADVRVMVLDGQVLAGMKRVSPHDFRTNVARQAIAQPHEVTARETELAIAAAHATGARIAGVDLLYDPSGQCLVIEVNAVPGWQALARVSGLDVAARLLSSIRER